MSRTCPDCAALQSGRRIDEPHEYLVASGRSKGGGAVFYRCLLCNTFLTFAPEGDPAEDMRRWNPGFRPYGTPVSPNHLVN